MNRERYDNILKNQVESGYAAGINALIFHKNKEIYYGEYGVKDLKTKEPITRDTIFRMYSMTKPVTSVAGLILIERGLLSMNDPLELYLPEYAPEKLQFLNAEGKLCPLTRSITIWDLFHMTSGICYPDLANSATRKMGKLIRRLVKARENGEIVTTRDYAREIAQIPLVYEPHSKWLYGYSADVLGAVIEVISGMDLGAFMKKEIFDPLGMTDTGFCVPAASQSRFATGYKMNANNVMREFKKSNLGEYFGEDVAFLSGGAGLVSTIDDYMKFTRMLASGGRFEGIRILKEETVKYMSENHLSDEQKKTFDWDILVGYGYGCLVRSLTDRNKAMTKAPLGCFGWEGWMGTYMTADPENEIAIVYLMQRTDADTTIGGTAFRNEFYEKL